MKRIAIKLVVFLLLGAVVNVGVAWGYCIHTDGEYSYSRPLRDSAWLRSCVDGDVPSDARQEYTPSVGADRWSYFRASSTADFYMAEYTRIGLPVRCLHGGWLVLWQPEKMDHDQDQVFIQSIALPAREWSRNHWLPAGPIFPGFLINTVFYAVILWALWSAPFATRRLIRKRRGKCVRCGYDLTGMEHEVCPECGHVVRAEAGI